MNRETARARARDRCWAHIGVLGGDRSCPVLADCGHCRECVVFTVVADDLLARHEATAEPPASATPAAIEDDADSVDKARLVVITFEAGGQALALEVDRVVEVGAARPVRRVPHRSDDAFLGLVSVQGRLEPCFSLPAVLGLPSPQDGGELQLLVIGDEHRRCAFHVTGASLREVHPDAVAEPPATVTAALDTHVRGILRIGREPWSWLDAERLMTSLERRLT